MATSYVPTTPDIGQALVQSFRGTLTKAHNFKLPPQDQDPLVVTYPPPPPAPFKMSKPPVDRSDVDNALICILGICDTLKTASEHGNLAQNKISISMSISDPERFEARMLVDKIGDDLLSIADQLKEVVKHLTKSVEQAK